MKLKARVIKKPEVPISLRDAGIDKNLADRARKATAAIASRYRKPKTAKRCP
jgi:hypothetical protein